MVALRLRNICNRTKFVFWIVAFGLIYVFATDMHAQNLFSGSKPSEESLPGIEDEYDEKHAIELEREEVTNHHGHGDPVRHSEFPIHTLARPDIVLKERLSFIQEKMKNFIQSLETIRDNYLILHFPMQTDVCKHVNTPISRITKGKYDNHFDLFDKYFPKSSTLIFRTTPDMVGKGLTSEYYYPSSNNCTLTHDNTRMGKVQEFGCMENIQDTFHPVPIQPLDFQSVFPVHFRTNARNEMKLFYIHVIPQAVVTSTGYVISENSIAQVRVCELPTMKISNTCPSIQGIKRIKEVFVIDAFPDKNYYHTNGEGAAKLAPYVPFSKNNPQIKVHVSSNYSFLPLLGLFKNRLVNGPIAAKVVYLPSGSTCASIGLMTGQLLSMQLRLDVALLKPPRDIIVSVKRSSRRYFKYHDEIHAMLKMHAGKVGLSVRVFDDHPLPDIHAARMMFYRAVIVVAPHGAGQTNLFFSQPGTILIEGLCPYNVDKKDQPSVWNIQYLMISKRLGMRYYGMAYEHFCHQITAQQIKTPFLQYLQLLGYSP